MLGQALGVLVSDRYAGYLWWPACYHQFCWAHLKRDVTAISERDGDSERIGKAMLEEIGRMFAWWHRVRDSTMARDLSGLHACAHAPVRGIARAGCSPARFQDKPDVCKDAQAGRCPLDLCLYRGRGAHQQRRRACSASPRHPTQDQRILRKISGGTHCSDGSRFIERILTVHATLRQQRRSILDFLCDACQAALLSRPAPSLLPLSATAAPVRADA